MFALIASCIVSAAVACAASWALFRKVWMKRIEDLERDLQVFSGDLYQMAEVQMESYKKLAAGVGEIEERILDLSIPSQDSNLPLERRRRVVALAAKGGSVDEIAKRVSIPRGEAELIMSLQKCRDSHRRVPKTNGESSQYAQA